MRYGDGTPSRWTLVAAAVVFVAIGAAVLDYVVADARLGPFPECPATSPACIVDQNLWLHESKRRSDEVGARTWAYALLVLVAVTAATARALLRRPPADRRTIFASLGSAAVALGVAHAVLLWINQDSGIDGHQRPGWAVVALLLVTAAAGAAFARLMPAAPPAPAAEPRWRTLVGNVAVGGLGLTAATVVLAVVFMDQQPACGGSGLDHAPAWAELLLWGAVGTSLAAAALVVVGLAARRWLLALTVLTINPVVLFFMVASTCAFY